MKNVIIEINSKGIPTIKSAPKKVNIIFKYPKKPTFKKRIKSLVYRIKAGLF